MTIGVVGAGNMGSAIVHRLAIGDKVLVYDRDSAQSTPLASDSVLVAEDLEDLAQCDAVVLSLPSPQISESVVNSLAEILTVGTVVVETSTVLPSAVVKCGDALKARGVHFVDAAILSGVDQMRSGTTTLLIGGTTEAIGAAASVLELLSPRRVHLGGPGAGMAAKVVNNAVSHAVMVVLVEALAMAKMSGVDPAAISELLAGPDGGLIRPLTHRVIERMFKGAYLGGMPTEAARKDSTLALALAQEHRIPLFAIQAAHSVYEIAVDSGLARDDYSAIARLWERWTRLDFVADV